MSHVFSSFGEELGKAVYLNAATSVFDLILHHMTFDLPIPGGPIRTKGFLHLMLKA